MKACRRKLIAAAGAALLTAPCAALRANAQQIARVGYLFGSTKGDSERYIAAFREGLRELGYVEGRNIVIEYRWADGNFARLAELAAELAKLPVQVIVAVGDPVVAAARQAAPSVPVVMASVGDPVGRGFVASLARPGGNITGVSNLVLPVTLKWLQSAKEIVPAVQQVAILRNDANSTHALLWAEAQAGAASVGVKLQAVDLHVADDVDRAFTAALNAGSGVIVVLPDPLLAAVLRHRIAELGIRHRVPVITTFREQVEAGSLMSYGPSLTDNHRRAAAFVDKILKGARPAELPVEQPTRFELIINLKTAKALGLALPSSLLARADAVIQ